MKNFLKKLFVYEPKSEYFFSIPEESKENEPNITYENQQPENKNLENLKIYNSVDVNLEFMKSKYNVLINTDIVVREFSLVAQNKTYSAFIMYIDGMVNGSDINDFILKPLMLKNQANTSTGQNNSDTADTQKIAIAKNITVKRKKKPFDLEEYIFSSLMPQNNIKKSTTFTEISEAINMGNTALFIDTLNVAFNIELKGFEKRSISTPQNEVVVRGSQEAFIENLRTNTSLIRRIINNENLITEQIKVGKITKTTVAVCYMKNITNESLINEVKYRINNLDLDAIVSSGQLEQLIEDSPNTLFPQILSTERPDKVANYLLEGRVAIIVNGSPYALIAPSILIDFLSSPEDINLKYQYGNMLRIIRFFAFLIALLTPAFYIAITYYHEELLPTELLFAMASARETVPFPILFELLIMELSFELIREAILRVPAPIGPTIRNRWSINFRRSRSYRKHRKPYFNNNNRNNRNLFICITKL